MISLTYLTLQNAISNYLERQDDNFWETLPLLINLAQRRLSRDLKLLGTLALVSYNNIDSPIIDKPVNWLANSWATCSTTDTPLSYRGFPLIVYMGSQVKEKTLNVSPTFYTDVSDSQWMVFPLQDKKTYDFQFSYYQIPPLLSDDHTRNFFTDILPDALIQACLLEAVIYLQDDARIPLLTETYNKVLTSVQSQDLQSQLTNFTQLRNQ